MKTIIINDIVLDVTTQGGYSEPNNGYKELKEINEVLLHGVDIYELLSEEVLKQIKEEING